MDFTDVIKSIFTENRDDIDVSKSADIDPDDESRMIQQQLQKVSTMTNMLADVIETGDQFPAWIQDKISVMEHSITAIVDYLSGPPDTDSSQEHTVSEDDALDEGEKCDSCIDDVSNQKGKSKDDAWAICTSQGVCEEDSTNTLGIHDYPDAGENAQLGVKSDIESWRQLPLEEREDQPLLYWLLGEGTPDYKMSPEGANYTSPSEVEGQTCGNCEFAYHSLSEGSHICSQIRGEIDLRDWCKLWHSTNTEG